METYMLALNIDNDDKLIMLSEYAENVTQRNLELMKVDPNYQIFLPTSLFLLSKLENEIEITDDPSKIKDYVFDFKIDIEEIASYAEGEEGPSKFEDYTIKCMLEELSKFKKLIIYQLISNVTLTREVEKTDKEDTLMVYGLLRVHSRIEVKK
jgi:hypothetical protein